MTFSYYRFFPRIDFNYIILKFKVVEGDGNKERSMVIDGQKI